MSASHLPSMLPAILYAFESGLCDNMLCHAGQRQATQPLESTREQVPVRKHTSNQVAASPQGPSLLDELLGVPAPAGETVPSCRICRMCQLEPQCLHMRRQ